MKKTNFVLENVPCCVEFLQWFIIIENVWIIKTSMMMICARGITLTSHTDAQTEQTEREGETDRPRERKRVRERERMKVREKEIKKRQREENKI